MKQSPLAQGNLALRNKDYEAAIRHYTRAKITHPELAEMLQGNIELAYRRGGIEKSANGSLAITTVDIVVPVYNALEDVKKCLESLQRCTDQLSVKIIIVNDGSDEATAQWLREHCSAKPIFKLIEHAQNVGYTKAVNTGLKASSADYAITQNSDTIVSPGWLTGLIRCMNSSSKIGIVGPLSNAASWQNVPNLRDEQGNFAVNDLPVGYSVEDMARAVQQASTKAYPRLPFVNGFCFMIKREVIESIGYMDEENFPVGYGEENDYCIRAIDAGYELVIADDVYVFHAKSKSFGHDRRKQLSEQGNESLKKKYTASRYNATIEILKREKTLEQIRAKLLKKYNVSNDAAINPEPTETTSRKGHDAFMLRGLRPTAEIAIIANVQDEKSKKSIKNTLKKINQKHDLFLMGEATISDLDLTSLTNTITYVNGADENGNACEFLRLANSNVFDDYQAVLWLAPSEGSESELIAAAEAAESFLKDPDYGVYSFGLISSQSGAANRVETALKITLPRLGIQFPETEIKIPKGPAIWIKSILLRGLGVALLPEELNAPEKEKGFPGRATVLAVLAVLAEKAELTTEASSARKRLQNTSSRKRDIKTVAFYLPQFHPIPENDLWWGKGFTEWTNVTRSKQLFKGHYQPRVPSELGYYDLRLEDTQVAQAELAREFGIHGFCYYYYWFDGKKLLNHPIEQMARSTKVDAGFCVCWANENWSRNWDGQNRHVLMEQTYTLESNLALMRELIPMMKDPRWIRHKGKPVMMVYRISIIPNWLETAAAWRQECREAGLGEIHLCAVRFGLETLQGPPEEHGIDSYVLFPPHEAARVDLRHKVADLNKNFNGQIFDYTAVVEGDLAAFNESYSWPVHRGAMLGWDNTARRLNDARIFHGATPFGFRRWMKGILEQEQRLNTDDESLIFINAWNEWAEGTYLEPDQRWGRTYLKAFSSAVKSTQNLHPCILPRGVASQPRGTTAMGRIGNPLAKSQSVNKVEWNQGDRAQKKEWPTVMLCAHISGHQLFGGERSLLDVLEALAELPLNIVMTLPSGKNKAYIRAACAVSIGVYAFPYPQWKDNREIYAWLTTLFADIIARHAVDIVHANTIVLLEPLSAATRMGRTRVVHARELISLDDPLRQQLDLNVSEILNSVFQNSDWVIGNSKATCQLFSRPDRIIYVPNAVTLSDFDIENKFGNIIKFGIVSSNIPKKGVGDFVEVARRSAVRAPRARFVIVGPVNEQVKNWQAEVLAGARPDNLIIAGYAEHPRKAMSELNVLLNLSHFAESFGRTVAEGMAARRPVIAYDWGALSELIKHGKTGYLAPYQDIESVVKAVINFCDDDKQIVGMGEAGREFVKRHFAQQNLQTALAEGYTSIIGRPMLGPDSGQPSPTAARAIGVAPSRTTVIIPVFNAPKEVHDCLSSIIKHTDLKLNRVLVINDGSPDPTVVPILNQFKGIVGITILQNAVNIGYTKTINRGIAEAGNDDVILLNSDTIVTPTWLEGLRATAYSRPKVSTVTAMSDNAGAFSFPKFNEYCPRPSHLTHEEYALLITQATQYCSAPEVPTGSGFCMYIRRALLDECGIFDEEGFPRGYGEENDFCMRAYKAGWVNLISPWSFVYHIRTASFKGEKAALVKAGGDVVTKRYPDYALLVKRAFSDSKMSDLRIAAGNQFV